MKLKKDVGVLPPIPEFLTAQKIDELVAWVSAEAKKVEFFQHKHINNQKKLEADMRRLEELKKFHADLYEAGRKQLEKDGEIPDGNN